MTERLSSTTLHRLPSGIRRPAYDRNAVVAGVLHIGLGAFHRAHQAPLFDALLEDGDLRWGVVGASLRSAAARDALVPQEGLYSLAIEHDGESTTSVIGAILDVVVAREDPHRLIQAIAAPQTHLVTITVTEKGYKLDPVSGLLLEDDPDVRTDLTGAGPPATMPGYLAAGLKLRKQRSLPPLAILSCDNMTGNGSKLREAVVRIAGAHDAALASWIEQYCALPNSVVDRIVPAMRDADLARTASVLGVVDQGAVRTEPFSQWVIEKGVEGLAQELERVGVSFTSDLRPWEQAKLRLLNGAHSAMAYIGGLAGVETVDAFVRLPWGSRFVEMLWDELETTLAPSQLDVAEYRRALMGRFANSALSHRLRQIAMDGSQKIPQRLVAAAADRFDHGRRPDAIALAIAGWMRWQCGVDDSGLHFVVNDPLASTTARLANGTHSPRELARALLALDSIFPRRLCGDPNFCELVGRHLEDLCRFGARAALERFVSAEQAEVTGGYR